MSTRMQSVKVHAARVVKDNVASAIKSMPAPLESDVWIYRMIVASVSVVLLISVAGIITLSLQEKSPPDVLVALVSAALGGLTGLLAPTPKRK
jgi:hypothetical protein